MLLRTVTLLAIDLTDADPTLVEAFAPSGVVLERLVGNAFAETGSSDIVVFSDRRRFELYATDESRPGALRSILGALRSRAGGRDRLGELRVIEAEGPSAARHLMRVACGVGAAPGQEMLAELGAALERSRRAGMLGPELSSLFAFAMAAGFRAESERLAGELPGSAAEPVLASLEIDRIVEEELVAWRRALLTAIETRGAANDPFESAGEAGTFVRVKAPSLRSQRLA
jgi:glutamyl-tRNA reductase